MFVFCVLSVCLGFLLALPSPARSEQLEMDVITVYGKESYRFRREVFDLLAPMRKEDLVKMKLKKRVVEEVTVPVMPLDVSAYDTDYALRPEGEVPTVSIVRTGLLLYFLTRKSQIENLRLEFLSRTDPALQPQEIFLKKILKDQYVEVMLPDGLYRMALTAEGFSSREIGEKRIGHFGFFRRAVGMALWPRLLALLEPGRAEGAHITAARDSVIGASSL